MEPHQFNEFLRDFIADTSELYDEIVEEYNVRLWEIRNGEDPGFNIE